VEAEIVDSCTDSVRSSTCCTPVRRSCCNPCGGSFTEVDSTAEIDATLMTEKAAATDEDNFEEEEPEQEEDEALN